MKKLSIIGILIAFAAVMLFAGCQNAEQQEKVNVRLELSKQSTLEKILKSGELRVGFESGYMPFEMTDKNGKFVGLDMDMAREMAKALKVKFVPVNTSWDGIIPALLSDKFDIIMGGMTVTQQRNLKVNFANPYIVIGQTAIVSKRLAGKVKSYKDLNNPKYTIVSRLGSTGEQAVKKYMPKAKYRAYQGQAEAAMVVVQGKADAFIYDLPFCAKFYAKQGASKIIFLDKPFTYEPLAWAIKRGDADFLNWLNNFLTQVKNDGRYAKSYHKWFNTTGWFDQINK